MKHVSNEQKADEICRRHIFDSNHFDCCMEMAQWKDEQFAKEKQQLIDKACMEFCNNCNEQYGNCEKWCKRKPAFKKAMEEL